MSVHFFPKLFSSVDNIMPSRSLCVNPYNDAGSLDQSRPALFCKEAVVNWCCMNRL